jgi:hypothetical protein
MHRLPVYDRQLRPPRPPFHRSPDDRGDRRLYLGLAAHGEPGHGGAQHAHRREDRPRKHHATAPDREPREDPGDEATGRRARCCGGSSRRKPGLAVRLVGLPVQRSTSRLRLRTRRIGGRGAEERADAWSPRAERCTCRCSVTITRTKTRSMRSSAATQAVEASFSRDTGVRCGRPSLCRAEPTQVGWTHDVGVVAVECVASARAAPGATSTSRVKHDRSPPHRTRS